MLKSSMSLWQLNSVRQTGNDQDLATVGGSGPGSLGSHNSVSESLIFLLAGQIIQATLPF